MSEKVAAIEGLLKADSLATNIYSFYSNSRLQSEPFRKELRELRNYIFATSTLSTSASSLPWKNTTTIPKIAQIRDNLHANYMSALFPGDDWLDWQAYTNDAASKKKKEAIKGYMLNKIRTSDFKSIVSKMVYDYIDTGNVFADVEYVDETYEGEGGETKVGYIGPRPVRISPYDIEFNATATSFKDTWKIVRHVLTVGELISMAEEYPEMGYIKDAIEDIKSTRSKLSAFNMEDVDKAEAYKMDGFGTLSEYYGSGYVELLVFEGSIYDSDNDIFLKNYKIIVADRRKVIFKEENITWSGKSLKEHVGWRDRPDNLWAMGPLANLVGMQYRLDHLENLKADALDLNVYAPLKVVGDVPPFTYGPFEQIRIPDADGDVQRIPPDPSAFQVNNEIGFLLMLMEEMAGAPKEAMGLRSPGEKTAFEVDKLATAASRIFQQKIERLELFIEKLINNMLEEAKRNLGTRSDVARIIDDDLGVETFITITKEDITADGKLIPVGARHYAAQAKAQQNLTMLQQSGLLNLLLPHLSKKKLATVAEELLDLGRFDLFRNFAGLVEDAEMQRMVNQLSEQVEVDSITEGDELGDVQVEEEEVEG